MYPKKCKIPIAKLLYNKDRAIGNSYLLDWFEASLESTEIYVGKTAYWNRILFFKKYLVLELCTVNYMAEKSTYGVTLPKTRYLLNKTYWRKIHLEKLVNLSSRCNSVVL